MTYEQALEQVQKMERGDQLQLGVKVYTLCQANFYIHQPNRYRFDHGEGDLRSTQQLDLDELAYLRQHLPLEAFSIKALEGWRDQETWWDFIGRNGEAIYSVHKAFVDEPEAWWVQGPFDGYSLLQQVFLAPDTLKKPETFGKFKTLDEAKAFVEARVKQEEGK